PLLPAGTGPWKPAQIILGLSRKQGGPDWQGRICFRLPQLPFGLGTFHGIYATIVWSLNSRLIRITVSSSVYGHTKWDQLYQVAVYRQLIIQSKPVVEATNYRGGGMGGGGFQGASRPGGGAGRRPGGGAIAQRPGTGAGQRPGAGAGQRPG